ncbi:uncharacterized protein MONOS_2690 [Monocercomonoides exilis]|uniref:uncharacterized protein n=1 Tax=Monocercomonoides exilis TaxID=2049356 RepID=UPI003559F857|nr:hypothetical protein MONOS_2690 [Monocercomonoides exilis]|eukprot:MONOS_2690.1-p1 / transcript=MONOS_2690.1 / gene=MONOS_2690 / organism=Monocercomonoides_exilis_PA203 / gene_product=unspecified product / transcript_product=unspecified product / location=Mono_scaffold00056:145740-147590(-) / protein_length=617 / sequence_SO=supercontig / SO=protein_coding / is_pseudo=false
MLEEQFVRLNEESKGGALYIRGTDDAFDSLKISVEDVTFSDCEADKGTFVYLSLPKGREQINEEQFLFEMEGIYGKQNFMLLEARKEGRMIDLMEDKENILPYHSENIYVGGEEASEKKTCGRKEEPCKLLSTGIKHGLSKVSLTMAIRGAINIDEPVLLKQDASFASDLDSCSGFCSAEPNRGTLRIGAKMKAGESTAVFDTKLKLLLFERIDIEYPDSVEGDPIDLINVQRHLDIYDVIFRPWHAELKEETILGEEEKVLPYKLIVVEGGTLTASQLIIYGRNGNMSGKAQLRNNENKINYNFFNLNELGQKPRKENGKIREDNPFCSWDNGLVFLRNSYVSYINDSSFFDISDGAILASSTALKINNCTFLNNHPIGIDWKKFPSLRHNIRQHGKKLSDYVNVNSLASGSDGLKGKPFGMLSDIKASGKAADKMDSYFFAPVLKNVTFAKNDTSNANEIQDEERAENEIEAIVQGSYLFPCGLIFEVSKNKKGQDMKWNDCTIYEYANETEMKVKIPQKLIDVDEYTSVVCSLTYPDGTSNGLKKRTENVVLIKQKKVDPKDSPKPQKTVTIILVSVFVSIAVVVVVVVVIVYVVRNKKRRQYVQIQGSTDNN